MLLQLLKDPPYGLHVALTWVFSGNEDVIQVYDNENVQLFGQNLVDLTLKTGRYIEKPKGHDLMLEIAVPGPEGGFPVIAFSNSHPVVGVGEVQLSKALGPA